MKTEVSKKKNLHYSLYNFWYCIRISLLVLFFVLGTAITLCALGIHKNVYMMRCSLALFIGTGIYLLYLLVVFVFMLIKIKKQKDSDTMELKVLENGELYFKWENIDCIVDRTKINWVREHKSSISFYIRIRQKEQLCVLLSDPIEEKVKEFILSCKKNKKLKIPVIYTMLYLLFIVFAGIFSSIRTTYKIDTENQALYTLSQKYNFKSMLDDLCPQGLIDKTPISQRYYYHKEIGAFSLNPPTVALITFVYSPQDYDYIKNHLQTSYPKSEWMKNYKGTTFYIHPKFTDSNSFGFIGYNKSENRIIFLGYEEGYVSYSNPLESDLGEFIEQIYGRRYPGN